jgi:hypothetical protein
MKRLVLGIIAAAFFGLVGIESTHFHATSPEPCGLCALTSQAIRHVSIIATPISAVSTWTLLSYSPKVMTPDFVAAKTPARDPPRPV